MKKIAVVIALIVSMLLTACGGAGDSGPSTSLNIDMSEFMFSPTNYTIPAGQQITLELKNSGEIKHDFIILKKGILIQGSFDYDKQKDDVYFQAKLDAHQTDTFTFTAPAEAGEYQVICGIPGHFQTGMIGKLTVAAP